MDGQKEACYTDKEYGEQARIREKRKGLFISVFFIIRAPALVCVCVCVCVCVFRKISQTAK